MLEVGQTIERITKGSQGEAAVPLLCLLAEAKAPLSTATLQEILRTPAEQALRSVLQACRDVVAQCSTSADAADYQLVSSSARAHLRDNHTEACADQAKRLADFCFGWRDIRTEEARQYALRHAADHLCELRDRDRAWELTCDEAYRDAQFEAFGEFGPSMHALRQVLSLHLDRSTEDPDDVRRLAWLARRAGELGELLHADVRPLFCVGQDIVPADSAQIPSVLKELSSRPGSVFLQSILNLLWEEAVRELDQGGDGQSFSETFELVFEAAEHKMNAGPNIHNFGEPEDAYGSYIGDWGLLTVEAIAQNRVGGLAAFAHGFLPQQDVSIIAAFAQSVEDRWTELPAGFTEKAIFFVDRLAQLGNCSRIESFCRLAVGFGGNRNMAAADECLRRACELASTPPNDNVKAKAKARIAVACGKIGDFERALKTARSIEPELGKPKPRAVFENGDMEYDYSPRDDARNQAFHEIAIAAATQGVPEHGTAIVQELTCEGRKSAAIATIAETVASAPGLNGEIKKRVFCGLRDLAVGIAEGRLRYEALLSLGEYIVKCGPVDLAKEVLDQASEDFQYSDPPFIRLFIAQSKVSDKPDQAIAGAVNQRLGSSAVALSELARHFARSGHFELAFAAIERIDEAAFKTMALSGVAAALHSGGQQDEASPLFSLAVELLLKEVTDWCGEQEWRCRKSSQVISRAVDELIQSLLQSGRHEQTSAFLEQLAENSCVAFWDCDFSPVGWFRDLAVSLVRSGRFADACETIKEIHPSGFGEIDPSELVLPVVDALLNTNNPEAVPYIHRAAFFAHSFAMQAALAALLHRKGLKRQATRCALTPQGMVAEDQTAGAHNGLWERLSVALALSQRFDEAVELAGKIEDEGARQSTFVSIVELLVEANQTGRAEAILNERFPDLQSKISCLCSMGRGTSFSHLRLRYYEWAYRCLQDSGLSYQFMLLSDLVRALVKSPQFIGKTDLITKMLENADCAEELWTGKLLQRLARTVGVASSPQLGQTMVRLLLVRAQELKGPHGLMIVRALAEAVARARFGADVKSISDEILAATGQWGGEAGADATAELRAKLAFALGVAGFEDEAYSHGEGLAGDDWDEVLSGIVRGIADKGETDRALTVAAEIANGEFRAVATSHIAHELAVNNKSQQARDLFHQSLEALDQIPREDTCSAVVSICESIMHAGLFQANCSLSARLIATATAMEQEYKTNLALHAIANGIASSGQAYAYESCLSSCELSQNCLAEAVLSYQGALERNLSNPIPHIWNAFALCPFESRVARETVERVLCHLISQNDTQRAQAVTSVYPREYGLISLFEDD